MRVKYEKPEAESVPLIHLKNPAGCNYFQQYLFSQMKHLNPGEFRIFQEKLSGEFYKLNMHGNCSLLQVCHTHDGGKTQHRLPQKAQKLK